MFFRSKTSYKTDIEGSRFRKTDLQSRGLFRSKKALDFRDCFGKEKTSLITEEIPYKAFWPRVCQTFFSGSTQLSMKISLLINMNMQLIIAFSYS